MGTPEQEGNAWAIAMGQSKVTERLFNRDVNQKLMSYPLFQVIMLGFQTYIPYCTSRF